MVKTKRPNIIPVRFSDAELEYIKNSVDYFTCDSVSDVIRRCVRIQMEADGELQFAKKSLSRG